MNKRESHLKMQILIFPWSEERVYLKIIQKKKKLGESIE